MFDADLGNHDMDDHMDCKGIGIRATKPIPFPPSSGTPFSFIDLGARAVPALRFRSDISELHIRHGVFRSILSSAAVVRRALTWTPGAAAQELNRQAQHSIRPDTGCQDILGSSRRSRRGSFVDDCLPPNLTGSARTRVAIFASCPFPTVRQQSPFFHFSQICHLMFR